MLFRSATVACYKRRRPSRDLFLRERGPRLPDEVPFPEKEECISGIQGSDFTANLEDVPLRRIVPLQLDASSRNASPTIGGSVSSLRDRLLEMQIQLHSFRNVHSQDRSYLEAEVSALRAYVERLEAQRMSYWTLDDPPPF